MTRRENLMNLRSPAGWPLTILIWIVRALALIGQPLVDGLNWVADRLAPVPDITVEAGKFYASVAAAQETLRVPRQNPGRRTPGDTGPASIRRTGLGPNTGTMIMDGVGVARPVTKHYDWAQRPAAMANDTDDLSPAREWSDEVLKVPTKIDLHSSTRQASASEIAAHQYRNRGKS